MIITYNNNDDKNISNQEDKDALEVYVQMSNDTNTVTDIKGILEFMT